MGRNKETFMFKINVLLHVYITLKLHIYKFIREYFPSAGSSLGASSAQQWQHDRISREKGLKVLFIYSSYMSQ